MSTTTTPIDTTTWIDADTGHTFIRTEITSGDLKEVSIDTYQTFIIGETYEEYEMDHILQTVDVEVGYDDFGWRYDHVKWANELAAGAIHHLIEEQDQRIIIDAKLVEIDSPREYNFRSDRFLANFTLDLTLLQEWWEASGFTIEADAAPGGRHGSFDGFISFIDSRLREDRLGIEAAMMLDRYIESFTDYQSIVTGIHEWVSTDCFEGECITYWPNTNAALLAFGLLDWFIDDAVVNAFAAREVEVQALEVGDVIVTEFVSTRTVRSIEEFPIREDKGGGIGLRIDMPYSDNSAGYQAFRKTDKVFQAFNPAKDGENA